MKKRKSKIVLVSALLSFLLVISGCINSKSNDTTGKVNDGGGTSVEDPNDPYLGKYLKTIEVSTVRIIGDNVKFADGEDMDNNQWTRTLLERLGIKVKNDWIVKGEQPGGPGEQKMNVSIASGDLPDIFPVNATQLKQLTDAGQLMDLTKLYEKYASPMVKDMMSKATNGLASATFDGQLLGIPRPASTIDGASTLWIRKDWLTKLGLPEPKTMEDVLKISDAFTNDDPDGNGQKDTYGLALTKNLYGSTFSNGAFGTLEGFFNGYHAFPQQWIKDDKDNLVFGSIQPEMKEALIELQKMYKDGQIDREFGVKDETKEGELSAAGKIGMTYGQMWISLSDWLKNTKQNDPNAEWQAYPIVSNDSQPATTQISGIGVDRFYYVVNKDAKNPEALFKMMNLFAELQFGPGTSAEDWQKHSKVDGFEIWTYFPFPVGQPDKNLNIHQNVVAALDSQDASKLNPEETDAYKKSAAMESGNFTVDDWSYDKVFGRTGSQAVIKTYVDGNLLKPGEFYGVSTPTMSEKFETLRKMELEMVTKIILGESIDEFDKFVENWKKLGGDDITKEVNEWNDSK
jgi:putative aldouronate transport system substrate-binding protein